MIFYKENLMMDEQKVRQYKIMLILKIMDYFISDLSQIIDDYLGKELLERAITSNDINLIGEVFQRKIIDPLTGKRNIPLYNKLRSDI